jgi:hypothetical protein
MNFPVSGARAGCGLPNLFPIPNPILHFASRSYP